MKPVRPFFVTEVATQLFTNYFGGTEVTDRMYCLISLLYMLAKFKFGVFLSHDVLAWYIPSMCVHLYIPSVL